MSLPLAYTPSKTLLNPLRKDPLLKKEVWKMISEYRDVFSNSTPGCTDVVELQLRSLSGRNFAISTLGSRPN